VVLQCLELQLGAIFGFELESFIAAIVGSDMFVESRLVIFKKRGVTERPFAIRSPFYIHLQKAQVHAELDLFFSVLALELSDDNVTRLVIPLRQKMRYIEIHEPNMYGVRSQVNVSAEAS